MNIQYKAHDVELTNELRALVEEKLTAVLKLLAHHEPSNISLEAILAHDGAHHTGTVFRVDFTVFAGGERTHAVGHGETMHSAIDMAKDELVERLRREKEKHETLARKGGRMIKKMMRWG